MQDIISVFVLVSTVEFNISNLRAGFTALVALAVPHVHPRMCNAHDPSVLSERLFSVAALLSLQLPAATRRLTRHPERSNILVLSHIRVRKVPLRALVSRAGTAHRAEQAFPQSAFVSAQRWDVRLYLCRGT